MVSLPLPSSTCTSVVRMLPPTSVHARPVTRPTSLFSCTSESRNLGHAEEVGDVFAGDLFLVLGAVLHHAARHLAADVADFALEVAHAGLARVVADDLEDRIVGEGDVLLAQAGLLALLLHQVLLGDFELFVLGVALQAQDLHAVLQRRREWCAARSRWRRRAPAKGRSRRRDSDPGRWCSAPGRALRAAPRPGSPRKSEAILSTSSSRKTGFLVPACFMCWMIWPGSAPM